MESMTQVISFDFDDTLCSSEGSPNMDMISKIWQHHANGDECIIVTARNKDHEEKDWINKNEPGRTKVVDFISKYNLPITKIVYTNHLLKGPILKKYNAILHYDDNEEQLASTGSHGVTPIKVNNGKSKND